MNYALIVYFFYKINVKNEVKIKCEKLTVKMRFYWNFKFCDFPTDMVSLRLFNLLTASLKCFGCNGPLMEDFF